MNKILSSTALVHTRLCIYFWTKLIDEDQPLKHPVSKPPKGGKTVQNLISKSNEDRSKVRCQSTSFFFRPGHRASKLNVKISYPFGFFPAGFFPHLLITVSFPEISRGKFRFLHQ